MKYFATGRVLPERADVSFPSTTWESLGDGRVVAHCDSSQISITIDLTSVDGFVSAYLQAEHFALIVIGALGFALGTGYSVEIIKITEEDGTPHVFGVRPVGGENGTGLGFDPRENIYWRAFALSNKNLFFRFALRDYLRAINDPTDCATHCYRAIEGIKAAFVSVSGHDRWDEMHARLGTNRETINALVKQFADPVRHGNWINARPTSSAERWQMLALTRDILVGFLNTEPEEPVA